MKLLSVFSEREEQRYIDWLNSINRVKILKYHVELSTHNQFRETYEAAASSIKDVKRKLGGSPSARHFI